MHTQQSTLGWVLALLAFLLALAMLFLPSMPFDRRAVAIGLGLVAASRLLP